MAPNTPAKPIGWRGSSREALLGSPDNARREAGYQLHLVQHGRMPDDWKPMPAVGPGVIEVRLHTATEHRIRYVSNFAEAVYVLHAFEKKTRATRGADIELARRRYRALLDERRRSTR
jgi:phage-related protein